MHGHAFNMHLHAIFLMKYFAIALLINYCSYVAHANKVIPVQDNNVHISNNPCDENFNFRCFNNNVSPKTNLQHTTIGLLVSNRTTHQLMSRIFAIFLREFLHYENVTYVIENYKGSWTNDFYEREKLAYTLQQLNYQPTMPNVNMINLEVWMPALGHNLLPLTAYEATSSLAAGRFGWFVPKFHTDMDKSYNNLHYSIFQSNTSLYQRFVMPYAVMHELLKEFYQNDDDNWFISPLCENLHSCVILLAEHKRDTYFVIEQILETKSYLNVLWLGNSFREKVHFLYDLYKKSTTEMANNFIVIHWQPSDLINIDIDFHNIIMPNCDEFNFLQRSLCKYEQTPILKYYFKRLQATEHEQLLVALRRFKLTKTNLKQLMQILAEKSENSMKSKCDIYNEVACDWLKNNSFLSKNWLTTTNAKKTIYIGGIFPLTSVDGHTHHSGVLYAVRQAVQDINRNDTILRNYNLAVYEIDGKCRNDVVLQAFIHYFNQANLLGVLGPACSNTFMPIAGISKHTNMPIISYAATGGDFNDRASYPYSFRTIGSDTQIIDVYLSLFKRYEWQRVATVAQEGYDFLDHMEAEFIKHNIDLMFNTKFSEYVQTEEVKKNLLALKQKRCKIIIADMSTRNTLLTFCQAIKLQMTSANGYVWFLTEKILYDLDESQLEELNCTTMELQNALENHLIIKHRAFGEAKSTIFNNVTIQEWINNFPRKYLSDYVGFSYDAVWTFALAADKLFKENVNAFNNMRSKHVVQRFVELLWQTDFPGLTGAMRFGPDGSRITGLDIMQYHNSKLLKVGRYSPVLVENETALPKYGELNMNIWEENAPEDGTFDCSFSSLVKIFGIDCENVTNYVIVFCCLLFMISGCVISFVFWKSRYSKKLKRSARILRNYGIDPKPLKTNKKNNLDKWEISKDNLILNRRLGEGAFGTVYGGEARIGSEKWNAVAVKSLKTGACDDDRKDFLFEAQAMKRFSHHNIIKLLGVCLQTEPIYTIMEFMLYGDLKTFLLARRHLVNEKITEDSDISPKRLSMYAADVARGLAYLNEQRYVHRDIACRNCLVNADRTIKIGDFGMARATYESDYYRFNRKGMLPVRWMAPEALALGIFTTASDIWSYGIVLYEIITFGSYPYQGMTNGQVLEYVKSGKTIYLPKGIKPQLEELLRACWSPVAKDRPLASDILEYLSSYPRLVVPCLDFPGTSLMFSEAESSELELELELLSKMYNNPSSSIIKVDNDYNFGLPNNNNQITEAAKKRIELLLSEIDMRQYTAMDIPDYSNSDGTTNSTTASTSTTTANTPTTPDGYSIMSPLLMTTRSNSTDSSYAS